MLTISKPLTAGQAQTYHKLEFTDAGQSYYKQDGAVEGQWQGELAKEFGLEGTAVGAREFALLSDGKDPRTEEQIVGWKTPTGAKSETKNAAGEETAFEGKEPAQDAASVSVKSAALSTFVLKGEPAGEKVQEKEEAKAAAAPAEHRAAWDLTFSPPKSFSLVALVGGDERVREAHYEAVTIALNEVEPYTQARIGGNAPGETTGRFVAAKFEHDTARPVDGYAAPQLHTHAVVFNITQRDNGRFRALQPKSLYETQSYATAVYQAALLARVRTFGYEFTDGKSGAPEIKGFTQEYLDASSPRSQQIKEHLEKAGMQGSAAAQIAAHATRDGKVLLSAEEVLAAHRKLAREHGNQAENVVVAARGLNHKVDPDADRTPEREAAARVAVAYAKEHIYEREAVADRRDILRDALRRGMGETTAAEVKAEFQRRRELGEFRQAGKRTYDTERRFTTPETLAAERAVLKAVWDGHGAMEPMMKPGLVERQIAASSRLNAGQNAQVEPQSPANTMSLAAARQGNEKVETEEKQAAAKPVLNATQKAVIEQILTSPDRIQGLQGLAGTGKTTTLEVIRQGAERAGYVVEGFAPTSKAAGQLREAGINAGTLQGFLARASRGPAEPGEKHLYMLDESSLASTRDMRDFLRKLAPEDRVLVIGDVRQHQGVDAGRPFEQMQQGGMRTAQLTEIVRQKDPELRRAVEHLAKGETAEGVKLLEQQGRIKEMPDAGERHAAIAKDYIAGSGTAIIVSPDNASRRELNTAVRDEMRKAGKLAAEDRTFQTLTGRGELTGADRAWAARYQEGDIIRYAKGSKQLGLGPGSYATVTRIDAAKNEVTVRREDGKKVTYDPARLRGISAYRERAVNLATGDRLQFTAPDRKLGVANRDLGTVTEVRADRLTVRLDGKESRTVSFDPRQMRHIDHGYAVTSHSSQGLTADRVMINIDTAIAKSLLNARLAYVAVSRAAYDVKLYVSQAKGLDKLLSSDVSKSVAIEYGKAIYEGDASAAGPKRHVAQAGIVDPTDQLRQAVRKLGTDEARVGVNLLEHQGRLRIEPDRTARVNGMVEDYLNHRQGAVIVVRTVQERNELNSRIRSEMVRVGAISPEIRSIPVLVEKSISVKSAMAYKPGDIIEFRAGSKGRGIPPNSSARVLAVDIEKNRLTIQTPDGEARTYNPSKLSIASKSKVYEEQRRDIAVGERVRINAPYTPADSRSTSQLALRDASAKPERLRAGEIATVDAIRSDGGLRVRTDAGKLVELPAENAKHIEYGYAAEGTKPVRADRLLVAVENADQLTQDSPTVKTLLGSEDARLYASERTVLYEARTPEEIEALLVRTTIKQPKEQERQYAPLHNALGRDEAKSFRWLAATGTIQTYQSHNTGRNIHIDERTGRFLDQQRQPISRDQALTHALSSSDDMQPSNGSQVRPQIIHPDEPVQEIGLSS